MTTYAGSICFRRREDGGRVSGPPPGPTYRAIAVPALGGEAEVLPGWPATGRHFSVVLTLEVVPREGEWSAATVSALVEDAPGAEMLTPGAELVILEGHREVARMLIDRDDKRFQVSFESSSNRLHQSWRPEQQRQRWISR